MTTCACLYPDLIYNRDENLRPSTWPSCFRCYAKIPPEREFNPGMCGPCARWMRGEGPAPLAIPSHP